MIVGGALGLISMVMPWFKVPGTAEIAHMNDRWVYSTLTTAQALADFGGAVGWMCLICSVLVIILGVLRVGAGSDPDDDAAKPPLTIVLTGLAFLAVVLLRFGIKPSGTVYAVGIYLCLIGAIVGVAGSFIGLGSQGQR